MKNRIVPRRGMALLMVVVFIATAAIMSYAILSATSVQARVSGDGDDSAVAECLAESGINLATLYIQYPAKAPSLGSGGYWPGQNGISLGTGIDGTVDVTVTPVQLMPPGSTVPITDFDSFDIVSIGRVKTGLAASSSTISHTSKARVLVDRGDFPVGRAVIANGDFQVFDNTSIYGDLQSNGKVTVHRDSNVRSTIYARSISGSIPGVMNVILPASQIASIPSSTQVNRYKIYTYNGKRYFATKLNDNSLGPWQVLGATSTNPAGVYWTDQDVTMNGYCWIGGSLIIEGAQLIIRGSNNSIQSYDGFPALVSDGGLAINGRYRTLQVNGLCWLGGNVTQITDSKYSNVTIYGALMFGGSAAVDSNVKASIGVQYDSGLAHVCNFSSTQANASVKLVSWTP